MPETILVTGVIDIDPVHRDAAIAALVPLMDTTREEDGCEAYTFSADLADEGRFHLAEQWRDQAALDAHLKSPQVAELFGAMADFGVTNTSLTIWTGATGASMM